MLLRFLHECRLGRWAMLAACCLPGLVWADGAPASPFPGGGTGYLAQLLMGLLLVLAAIVVLAFLMRRMTGVQSRLGGEFRVIGGISLGARERMLLVQVGGTQLLLGVAPGRVQTLHVLDEPVDTTGPSSSPASASFKESPFARRLRTALLQRERDS